MGRESAALEQQHSSMRLNINERIARLSMGVAAAASEQTQPYRHPTGAQMVQWAQQGQSLQVWKRGV